MIIDLKTLAVDETNGVLRVQLNRMECGNAVTEQMLDDLIQVLSYVEITPDIRVLVLSGAGADFCLGSDRTELHAMAERDSSGREVLRLDAKARRVCDGLASSSAVTIARIHGKAIGVGFVLALSCDLRLGAETSIYRTPELALGLPMTWGGALHRAINEVGVARIRELALTAESFDAHAAHRLSVLHRIAPEGELDAAIKKWVVPILRRSATATRLTKKLFDAYTAHARMGDLGTLDGYLLAGALKSQER